MAMASLDELLRKNGTAKSAPEPRPAQECAWCAPKKTPGSHGICESCRERVLTQS